MTTTRNKLRIIIAEYDKVDADRATYWLEKDWGNGKSAAQEIKAGKDLVLDNDWGLDIDSIY